ncbi:complex I assembly factor ACAD9, mitochondrial [Phymastichus coffea]|uniref:complex I assembly factor ACAD9, mitochondrial n=1 Tax=Phymastichus coffea TaxID=108790 RepID=UPI00273AAC22|nr:complex I assembly factor ACAD9, mitochondrial [Phymastichus coffea]XP_058789119.1 complex I assembly factor ACAD9, mitochondrial [Phymastichus coffea]
MLIIREVSRRHLPCFSNTCYQFRHLTTKTREKPKDIMADFKTKLPAAKSKKPKRDPFVKNLFLGIVDTEFLAYPEPQHYDRYNEFQEWFQPLKDYMKTVNLNEFEETGEIPAHVIQKFRELGVFGTRIHEDYQGSNLLNSEFLQVLEVVSKVPALGVYLLKHSVPPINILNKYGTVEQKLKYLPKIALGQSLATIAVTERESGPSVNNIMTTGTLSINNDQWIINGEKTFVSNVKNADVFLIIGHASQSGNVDRRPETLTAFLVDKGSEGLHVAQDLIHTVGLKGFNTGRIIMKDVKIRKENILGKVGDGAQHLIDMFANSRHFIVSITISILKAFLELLIDDILQRKHFNQNLHETEMVKNVISNISCSIYSMESMLYMTAAMMDIYDNQDVQLEAALTEQYCIQECLARIMESAGLIGPRVTTLVKPFEQLFRDTFTVTNYDSSLMDTKIFSALLGVQHFGLFMSDKIKKERNPFMFPKNILMKMFLKENRLKLHLEEYLHPSLQECADFLDRSLFLLKDCTEYLLITNGLIITDRHANLSRLSDMACQIYAYIANVSRASRSYCIGNRDSENEIKMSIILSYKLEQRVKQLAEDIKASEYGNGDFLSNEIADITIQRKKYMSVNPLQRNY